MTQSKVGAHAYQKSQDTVHVTIDISLLLKALQTKESSIHSTWVSQKFKSCVPEVD